MTFDIIIYCPDTHIHYNAALPDKKGVGGGLMARLRLAGALTRLGHRVHMIANVTAPHTYKGVEFIPLQQANEKRKTDILILVSSGGALSLEPALELQIDAKLRLVWVHGVPLIGGLDRLRFDFIISVSNFIRDVIREEWQPINQPTFVIYNGVPKRGTRLFPLHRDPFRLIYTSHPDKGLDAAFGVMQKLRVKDERYHLHVFGGSALYGAKDAPLPQHPGVTYFGTRRQGQAMRALECSAFSMQLQARPEPFGMVLTESMSRGAIPIASPVGAYPELLHHGRDGILVPGHYLSDEAQTLAAEWILRLNQNPDLQAYIRHNAQSIPWDWDNQAKVWAGFGEWALARKGYMSEKACIQCQGDVIALADGYHCLQCGEYHQAL